MSTMDQIEGPILQASTVHRVLFYHAEAVICNVYIDVVHSFPLPPGVPDDLTGPMCMILGAAAKENLL